jgi:hypothetical protein
LTRCLAYLLLAAPLFCSEHHTDQSCPWLNAATAAGILGGPVQCRATATTCDFVSQQAHAQYLLRIEVRTITKLRKEFASYLSRCGSRATPLKGIGNEAYVCPRDRRVIGRVRDQVFTIRVSTTASSVPAAALEEDARRVAEQVAGNLF